MDESSAMSVSEPTAPELAPSKGYRGWRVVVIVLGALNMLALGAVISAFIVRSGRSGEEARAYETMLPARGQLIESVNIEGNRILLRLSSGEGQELVVLDVNTGRLIGRIRLQAAP